MKQNQIRNAARALIIEEGHILLCKYIDEKGPLIKAGNTQ